MKSITDRINDYRAIIIDNPIDPITYNEWHSMALGLVGLPLGYGGFPLVTGLVTLLAITGYLPRAESRGIGTATVVEEPWYFSVTVGVTYAIGVVLRSL